MFWQFISQIKNQKLGEYVISKNDYKNLNKTCDSYSILKRGLSQKVIATRASSSGFHFLPKHLFTSEVWKKKMAPQFYSADQGLVTLALFAQSAVFRTSTKIWLFHGDWISSWVTSFLRLAKIFQQIFLLFYNCFCFKV